MLGRVLPLGFVSGIFFLFQLGYIQINGNGEGAGAGCLSAVLSNRFSVMDMWHYSPLSSADRETEAQRWRWLVHAQKQIREYTPGVLSQRFFCSIMLFLLKILVLVSSHTTEFSLTNVELILLYVYFIKPVLSSKIELNSI